MAVDILYQLLFVLFKDVSTCVEMLAIPMYHNLV